MRLHTEHFNAHESGRNKVIVVGETKQMLDIPDYWDIYIFNSMRSHYKYFREHIMRELEDPQVVAGGDLIPRNVFPDSPQSIFVHSGSLDNAGLTENGLGIEPEVFEAWRVRIEDAINKTIANIKANAARTSSTGR